MSRDVTTHPQYSRSARMMAHRQSVAPKPLTSRQRATVIWVMIGILAATVLVGMTAWRMNSFDSGQTVHEVER